MAAPLAITVGGGKGGIGKTTIVANMGYLLAEKGYSVGFIDADLGGANLHLCLGIKRPQRGLQDFMSGRFASLADVSIKLDMPGSWLISGAGDVLDQANPSYGQKRKLIAHMRKLHADYLLVDLGAGSSSNVTDFFAAFPFSLVVLDNLPTSIENAYGFIKNGVIRGLLHLFPGKRDVQHLIHRSGMAAGPESCSTIGEMLDIAQRQFPEEYATMRRWLATRKVLLVLSMVRGSEDITVVGRFQGLVKKYLNVGSQYIGYVAYLPEVRKSIRDMKPIVSVQEPAQARQCFDAIARNLIALTRGT